MPELPEVETRVRGLRQPLVGRTIAAVTMTWPRMSPNRPAEEIVAALPGQRIERVERRGKYLVFTLSSGEHLLIHLKMSGDLVVAEAGAPPGRHDRVVFDLDDGRQLRFEDSRKFGRVYLVVDPAEVTGALGLEPLAESFTPAELAARLRSRRRLLKPLLLDQTVLAGLGNIYTDEALFMAQLHPLRRSDTLTDDEIERLHGAIRAVLQRGIDLHGASIDWVYRGGGFQNEFQVYGREDRPCPRCGTPIRRTVVGSRGTFLCPACQRLDSDGAPDS